MAMSRPPVSPEFISSQHWGLADQEYSGHKYVALKVCERDSTSARREVAAYEHLNTLITAHSGALLIRQLLDNFKITGSGGEHICLVHEALGMSIETLRQLMPGNQLSEELLKAVLRHLFLALDCLHSEAKMVHTGNPDWIWRQQMTGPCSNCSQ